VLFNGTHEGIVASILEKRLLKGKRQHVHLSINLSTAMEVGRRHGKPVMFRIDTRSCVGMGLEFSVMPNGVWLTDHVPADVLALDE